MAVRIMVVACGAHGPPVPKNDLLGVEKEELDLPDRIPMAPRAVRTTFVLTISPSKIA